MPARVRVFKRRTLWHWWCPRCMGGDFGADVGPVWRAAFAHVAWHRAHA